MPLRPAYDWNSVNRPFRIQTVLLTLLVSTCVLMAVGGMNGCPGFPLPPGGPSIGGTSEYVGADVCRGCHRDVHETWSMSPHASAFEALVAAGAQLNTSCFPCHTTAYGEGGFVSAFATPKFGGVQCESCHGPGARHVGTRNPADINRIPGTSVCAECHTGPAQPNYDEWIASGHAEALDSVLVDPAATDACLQCHSTDYATIARQNEARALQGRPPLPLPNIENASMDDDPQEPVGCGSCHAPHGSPNLAQLRDAPTATCARCHTDASPQPGVLPHAPQWNVLSGFGGRMLAPTGSPPSIPSVPLVGFVSVHAWMDSLGGCAKCHGPNVTVPDPTPANPNQSGHRFEVIVQNCTPCHDPNALQTMIDSVQADVAARSASIRAMIDMLRMTPFLVEPNIGRLDAAELNLDLLEYDGSGGVHNVPHSTELLDAAQELVDAVAASI